ncbi:MAG: hypothetical protein N2383_03370 [Caldilineales bacterium]|nr:hypothetical protein [Caldilineales bacterium]
MTAITSLAAICTAIRTGLAAVPDLNANVTDNDWRVANAPTAIFVFPSGSGSQALTFSGSVDLYQLHYQVTVELWEKFTGNLRELYERSQQHIDAILAWFRQNDTLGDTSGAFATCHAEPLRWQAQDVRNETSGIDYRLITFTVTCLLTGQQ